MRLPAALGWEGAEALLWRGLRVFAFYLLLFAAFRAWFLFWMQDYMGPGILWEDVASALWRGFRLSCQSAGVLALLAFAPAALFHFLWERGERFLWDLMTGIELTALSILYVASFPFYRQFHSNFNQMIFQAVHEDTTAALFWSLVREQYLPLRFLLALLLAYVLWRMLRTWLWQVGALLPRSPALKWARRGLLVAVCYWVALLATFGGSLGWQTAVDWENAGTTKDELLNEAILDNLQAVYRAYVMQNRMLACNGLDFTVEDIRSLATQLAHRAPDTDDLDAYLLRRAKGAQMEKPKHIFVVLSESYANWPLLEKYEGLRIAEGMRGVIREEDSDYVPTFLPDGASTVSAVMGVVTGFADANLYLTTMPEAFREPYPTASAPQMERLGYAACFWYAGPATWERIGAFTKAQGFRQFFSQGDFGDVPGSVWGCEDKYLYDRILEGVREDEPGFHVILNASNHSPYAVDLEAEGFPREEVRRALPEAVREDEELLQELGHYWYADRELARFIAEAKQKFPDSLFFVVGDHADRYHVDKVPSMYERYGIPLIVTGKGVHKGILLPDSAGSQIDIVPTIIEMIAPEGFEYHALGSSLSRDNRQGVNYGFWIRRNAIGKADMVPLVPEALEGGAPPTIDDQAMQDYINAIRGISWWRAKYGPRLDGRLLDGR